MSEAQKAFEGMQGDELRRRLTRSSVRDKRVELRVTEAEKALIESLARSCGCSVTSLLVELAKVAAERLDLNDAPAEGQEE